MSTDTDCGLLAILAATVVAACAAGWWMGGVDIRENWGDLKAITVAGALTLAISSPLVLVLLFGG
jgi:hypothetical protein